jgi:hypothetical protein
MEHLRNLLQHFKERMSDTKFPKASDDLFAHIEKELLPHLMKIVKKDNTLFTDVDTAPELFPGIRVKWDGSDEAWQKVRMALMYAVLHGDPKEKFGAIFEQLKSAIPGNRQDEVTGILEDEETQNSLKEMLDLVMNTRLASVIGDLVQSIKFEDLDINLEDPDELIRLMQNPKDSDAIKEIMSRAQEILKDRIETGKINQQELIREIEMLRAKMTSTFGKYMNEMVVGQREQPATGNTSRQILSNSPEARRARMMARLQRKLGEKSRK